MKKYTVFWQYIANSGVIVLSADSPESAIARVVESYNSEFRQKANLFAFEGEPIAERISEVYPEKISRWP